MYKPAYSLTPSVLSNLNSIERYYGQLEAMQIPKELELRLEQRNLLESTYVSNSIEGNPLSPHEVTNLLLNDRVPTNRDEKEVYNFFAILEGLVKEVDKPLTLDLVLDFHQRLLKGVHEDAGSLRNEKVAVGRHVKQDGKPKFIIKHTPPVHQKEEIEKALKELLAWQEGEKNLPAPLKAGIFHHHFVYIHPFEDGNGRVCRLLTTLIFLKNNYLINKYFILDDYYDIDRNLYSDKLHSADKGDKSEWLEYFTEGVMYSLQSALARIKESYDTLKVENRPTPKEMEVIEVIKKRQEVTAPQVAEILKVSRQQAHNLLSGLIKKGLIDKKGKTKSSYYFLK